MSVAQTAGTQESEIGSPADAGATLAGRGKFPREGGQDKAGKVKRTLSAETKAKIQAAARARYAWDDAKVERIKALAWAGASAREIARQEGVYRGTFHKFCDEHNIPRQTRQSYDKASSDVLREHYGTMADRDELLRLYREVRGDVTASAMNNHAAWLGIKRPRSLGEPAASDRRSRNDVMMAVAARNRSEREELAPRMQALMNGGMSSTEAARVVGTSRKRMEKMLKEGLIVRPVREPKPKAPRRRAAPKTPPAPKPKARPASWVRVEKPATPKPTYQSVEEWLAAGNRITHCPAAVLLPTTHTPAPEDAAALRAYHDVVNARESGPWRERARKKGLPPMVFGRAAE